MKTKIVILQTSHSGYMLCREELKRMGLTNKDFKVLDNGANIEDEWTPGQRQLFITGTFSGSEEGVAEMVQKARQCNSELICMSFAISQIAGPFDHRIVKNSGQCQENLVAAVTGFLDGTINRADTTWTPPAPKKEQRHWAL